MQSATADSSGPLPARMASRVLLTGLGLFMVALDALVVVTALPAIRREVGGNLADLQWIIDAYFLVFAAGIIPAAALGDRIGRRRLYGIGLVLFSAASAACALAPSLGVLIAARAVQGLGAAIVTPLSLTLLMEGVAPARRGGLLGLWGGIVGLAVAAGPLVGGGVTQGLDWHWIFWVNVPVGIAVALFARVVLIESHGPHAPLDFIGAALISGSGFGLLWAIVRGNAAGWMSPEIVGTLAAGFLLLIGFLAWEARAKSPMVPLRLFANPSFAAAGACAFLGFGALFSSAFLAAQEFQLVLGMSPWIAGLAFLPWTATPLIVAPLAGKLADRIGPRPLVILGLTLQGLALAFIGYMAAVGVGYWSFVPPFFLGGVGISMALPAIPMATLGAVAPHEIGKASGVSNMLQRFGGAFGVAGVTAIFVAFGHIGTAASFTDGFRPALELSAAMSLLGALAALALASRAPANGKGSEVRVEEAAMLG
ncbi:MAG: DHA2 family efflux MFS transporter permease subunit [Thermoplasmatota archaeon]